MTSAQVVETSVKVTPNSPSQDYSHPDDNNLRTYDMTAGFKPFTVFDHCSQIQISSEILILESLPNRVIAGTYFSQTSVI